ncbi:YopX family protein [Cytobacillus horneckiae]|uniref:YopX family protein n=1 Tax=Cytobacillus horneckiae TaxID=549687 RepID=UPI003D9A2851
MREIKFRVYDKNSKIMRDWKWLNERDDLAPYLVEGEDDFYSSAMQYTALKDKNNKEIYEGDIINICRENTCDIAEVVFDEGCFSVIGYLGDLRTYPIIKYLFTGYEVEVVGTRYENPELINS